MELLLVDFRQVYPHKTQWGFWGTWQSIWSGSCLQTWRKLVLCRLGLL